MNSIGKGSHIHVFISCCLLACKAREGEVRERGRDGRIERERERDRREK